MHFAIWLGHTKMLITLVLIVRSWKSLFSDDSAESPLCNDVKIGTHESVQNAEIAKFDTLENKYIYSIIMTNAIQNYEL